jgi:hypothetical protein
MNNNTSKGGDNTMKNQMIPMIILACACAVGGFFGGMKYQQAQKPSFGQFANGNRQGAGGMTAGNGRTQTTGTGTARTGFRPVAGDIVNSDDKSITVKMQDGSTKIVLVTTKTTINKASEATIVDLKTGEKVNVFGTENTDGSVTAQTIQLNPILRSAVDGGAPGN